jgi:hypothetical protein
MSSEQEGEEREKSESWVSRAPAVETVCFQARPLVVAFGCLGRGPPRLGERVNHISILV